MGKTKNKQGVTMKKVTLKLNRQLFEALILLYETINSFKYLK